MGAYEFGIGDYDCDSAVDLVDYESWPACMTDPIAAPTTKGSGYPFPECVAFDFDANLSIDLADFAGFQEAIKQQP